MESKSTMEDWFKWLDRIIWFHFIHVKWSWINTSSQKCQCYWVWAGTVAGVVFVWDWIVYLVSKKKKKKMLSQLTTHPDDGEGKWVARWGWEILSVHYRKLKPELNSRWKERNFSFENQPCLCMCSTRSLVCYSIPTYLSVLLYACFVAPSPTLVLFILVDLVHIT